MPRLYHTKSRNGCIRCRARRVKCDEIRPLCGGCTRHHVDCVYDRVTPDAQSKAGKLPSTVRLGSPFASPTTSSSASTSGSSEIHCNPLSAETHERRYRELELLHLFVQDVCPTLPGTYLGSNLHIWTAKIPKLALTYEPLLNAILACSILYKVCTGQHSPAALEDLLVHRAYYFETMLQDHRQALGSLGPHIADAASFTSVLLSIDAFASLRDRHLRPLAPYRPPIQWLQMCKGVREVTSVCLKMVSGDPNTLINSMTRPNSFIEPSSVFCEANRSKFPQLLQPHHGERDDKDLEAYMAVVSYIGAIKIAEENDEERERVAHRFILFPILVPAGYIDLLGQCKPRALIILAHFFALAASFADIWWIGDSPAQEVHAIASLLGPEWQEVMEWPLQMAERGSHIRRNAAVYI